MGEAANTVDGYLDGLPEDRRAALQHLREAFHAARPDVVETMRYKLPSFETPDGELLGSVASQKRHLALYVCDDAIMDRFRDQLGRFDCGKGCVRFSKLDDDRLEVLRALIAVMTDPR